MNVTITIPGPKLAQVYRSTVGPMPLAHIKFSGKQRGENIKKEFEKALLSEMRQWCIENNCRLEGDDYSHEKFEYALGRAADYALTGRVGEPILDLAVTFRFASDADALFFKMRWF